MFPILSWRCTKLARLLKAGQGGCSPLPHQKYTFGRKHEPGATARSLSQPPYCTHLLTAPTTCCAAFLVCARNRLKAPGLVALAGGTQCWLHRQVTIGNDTLFRGSRSLQGWCKPFATRTKGLGVILAVVVPRDRGTLNVVVMHLTSDCSPPDPEGPGTCSHSIFYMAQEVGKSLQLI